MYHVLSRGIEKRKIFLDKKDYLRFIHDLFEFNDIKRSKNLYYYFGKNSDLGGRYINWEKKKRKLLVKIHAFCLMPNHYHLLLEPQVKNGIPKFMQKLNAGYVKYFNTRYERKGTLFERKYKAVPITQESHFIYIPYYIHLNPLDLKFPEWREKNLKDYKNVIAFLENYRWSSFLDYIGKKNFPSVTQRDFLLEFAGGPEKYKEEIVKWLREIESEKISDLEGQ